jgi:amino acid transporter
LNPIEQRLLTAEHQIEERSAELKKELSLTDLVLTQVLFITGLGWLGTAGKLGSSHFYFWVPAALFFYIPSALVVIHLSREMPLEGGLYQWAKLRFGEITGFLVAWNLWLYSVLLITELGVIMATNLAYAVGPSGAWMADSKPVIVGASTFFALGLTLTAIRGLALGKWIHKIGGVTLLAMFASMVLLALPRWMNGAAATPAFTLAAPALSLLNLNLLGKMAFGAFSGADAVAIFAGELRDPDAARSIRRSVWLAAPLVTAIFTLGTACVLAFVRPEDIDLISPVAQNLSLGVRGLGWAGPIVPLAIAMLIVTRSGTGSVNFNFTSRLPMVAGWDHLLPQWFTRLHPKYRTPMGSILFVGFMTLLFAIVTNVGVGSQEAYQLLNNGSGICYALTYLVMFAIPLIAPGEKPGWSLRLAALSGFLMTLLYVVLSVFPIIEVSNPAVFTIKVGGVVIGWNTLGALFFLYARGRRAISTASQHQ